MNEYLHDRKIDAGISMSGFRLRARQGIEHPVPRMGPSTNQRLLMQGKQDVITFGQGDEQLIAFGLLTCAAVIICSSDPSAPPRAAVYHAPSGALSQAQITDLVGSIGSPPAGSLLAAYVTPEPWDNSYTRDAGELVTFGIPTDQVTYLQRLPLNQFGINSAGLVGF